MTAFHYEPGHVIAGRYRLEALLGEGGMGAVWRAEHLTLKSPVALKFINRDHASNEEAVARFMLEAQSAAALRSTHIVQVFDFGVDGDTPYIAMELLAGESLAERLERQPRLSPSQTARILAETARAVDYAHGAGIVHRDLKPDNIFLVREGSVEVTKVLDFGIAKVTGEQLVSASGSKTATGALLGTPYYVSPEQARGRRAVDHRSDLWALGVIVYECLLGFRPFEGEALGDLLLKICSEPYPPPSEHGPLPRGIEAWFARALSKNPEERFPSAGVMSDTFSALLSQMPFGDTGLATASTVAAVTGGALGMQNTTRRSFAASTGLTTQSRRPRRKLLIASVVAVLLLGSGATAWLTRQQIPRAEAPSAAKLKKAKHTTASQPLASVRAPSKPAPVDAPAQGAGVTGKSDTRIDEGGHTTAEPERTDRGGTVRAAETLPDPGRRPPTRPASAPAGSGAAQPPARAPVAPVRASAPQQPARTPSAAPFAPAGPTATPPAAGVGRPSTPGAGLFDDRK